MHPYSTRFHVFYAAIMVFLAGGYLLLAHGNKHRESTATVGTGQVKVEYNAPLSDGRDLLSMIEPGTYWRMGADTATTLTTEVDLMFGETRVAKGTYVLSAHFVNAGQWSLVISKDRGRRGAPPQEILAEIPGAVGTTPAPVERLTITLEGKGSTGKLQVDWGTSRLSADFEAA